MKFEKVSENKLKVVINADDLTEYGITPDKLLLDAAAAQDFLHNLLKKAEEFDFYANGEQVMIEVVSSNRDIFTIYITKISNPADTLPHMSLRAKRPERRPRPNTRRNSLIFRFDDFEAVSRACQYITAEFVSKSNLYKYKDEYYLALTLKSTAISESVRTKLFDFGREETSILGKQGELSEHGELMIENDAIGVMRCYFK